MASPWAEGPKELLQHAVDHLSQGSDFDRRISMISIDNAVELTIKTYLGLPKRARPSNGPSRKELESLGESFPSLIDLLEKYAVECLTGVSLEEIEWFHRIRNQLYHSGNGITVEIGNVETYLGLAVTLYQNLFKEKLNLVSTSRIQGKFGLFFETWNEFEKLYRSKLPPKDDLAYYWKRDFFDKVDPKAVESWQDISEFRNQIVHGHIAPTEADFDNKLKELSHLHQMVKDHNA